MKHVQEMQADLGGTELLTPLQHVFGMKPRSRYARQIFVLTDGSVSNTQACIQQMKSNVKSARWVYTIGGLSVYVCIIHCGYMYIGVSHLGLGQGLPLLLWRVLPRLAMARQSL